MAIAVDRDPLQTEIQALRERLAEAEEALRAIRSGEVDGILVDGENGEQLRAFEESESTYRTLIEEMSEGALTLTAEGLILYANRRFAEMLGTSLEKVIGSEIHAWIAAESHPALNRLLRIPADDNRREELALSAADGAQVKAHVSANRPQRGARPDSFCMVVTDLTDQKRIEAVLSAANLTSAILDHAADAVVVCDATGRIIRASKEAHQRCGHDPVGLHFEQAFSLRQMDGQAFPVIGAIDAHPRRTMEAKLETDAQSLYFLVSVGNLKDAGNELLGSVVSLVDITERKFVEDQLRKLSLAVEQSLESIVITNLDAEIEYVNHAFVEASGYSREEVMGQNPRILQSGKTPPGVYPAMWAALSEGRPWKGELYNKRKDGGEYVEFAIITPLRQPDGSISHYVAVKDDITERKRLGHELDQHRLHLETLVEIRTAELVEARRKADAANIAKSTFLANMSHEIRTPMNGILGMVHILQREAVTPRQAERLDAIDRSAQHLLGLINDILNLSKIEAGKLAIEDVPVDLNAVLRNVTSILYESCKTKGIQLLVKKDYLPFNLHGDPTRLQQALLNYVANAVKFTEAGAVTIRVQQEAETDESLMLRFEVTDTGIGIPPEAMARLFHAFEQGEQSISRKYGGTGLGLVISRHLAELMGGETGAESTPGIGSRFWFTARLRKGAEAVVKPVTEDIDAETRIRQHHYGTRVLVADDEPINREVAKVELEAAGLVVDMAEDGAEAVAMAQTTVYPVILMDMQMPNVDGPEATRRIRAIPGYRQTSIIAMTANAFAEDKERCFEAGMNDFLTKPFNSDAFFAIVLRALGMTDPSN